MQELVDWTNKNLADRYYHPLIVIGIFVVNFLAIHPFQDGNGRLSRALTNLLLLKSGYVYVPYSSTESIIEDNKEGYYIWFKLLYQNLGLTNKNRNRDVQAVTLSCMNKIIREEFLYNTYKKYNLSECKKAANEFKVLTKI